MKTDVPKSIAHPAFTPTPTLELRIRSVAYGGKGVADHDGKVCFVPHALPGEIVRAAVQREHKAYTDMRLTQVLAPAPARQASACPLVALGCPGCVYQHASYEEELRLKQEQFLDLLSRLGGIDVGVVQAPTGAPNPLGYRNKMVLHAAVDRGEGTLGYVAEDNRTVIDVARCPLAAEPISELLAGLRAKPGFLRSLRDGMDLTLRWTSADGAVHWRARPDPKAVWLKEDTAAGRIAVPRGSFFQVNPAVADLLLEHVLGILRESVAARVIDLYGGVGLFAVAAARSGWREVVVVDSDAEAGRAAAHNLELTRAKARVIVEEAGRALPRLLREGDPRTVLIVDPPRAGLEPRVVGAIRAGGPSEIIYVSCGPDTLARDLRLLADAGYTVADTRLFDMFPRTAHFESVTVLRRE